MGCVVSPRETALNPQQLVRVSPDCVVPTRGPLEIQSEDPITEILITHNDEAPLPASTSVSVPQPTPVRQPPPRPPVIPPKPKQKVVNTKRWDRAAKQIFSIWDQEGAGKISTENIRKYMEDAGICVTDPRLKQVTQALSHRDAVNLQVCSKAQPLPPLLSTRNATCSFPRRLSLGIRLLVPQEFTKLTAPSQVLIQQIAKMDLAVPKWSQFCEEIKELFEECATVQGGKNARYIPELAKVNPRHWAVSVCTVSGQRYSLGDSQTPYTIQSASKVISYCLAAETFSTSPGIHSYVGHEPSGRDTREVSLNADGLPHNPMISSGGIVTVALLHPKRSVEHRVHKMIEVWAQITGYEKVVTVDEAVALSELQTANRNMSVTHLMAETGAFPPEANLEDTLKVYSETCAITMDTHRHAVAAATLAAGGVCPITQERVFSTETVKNCLSLMLSCGLNSYSGFVTYSPLLDEHQNSVKGTHFCKKLIQKYTFHQYDMLNRKKHKRDVSQAHVDVAHLDEMAAIYAASDGDVDTLQFLYDEGVDVNGKDYDDRTPLHVAAADNRYNAVYWLCSFPHINVEARDRFGNSPLDEAKLRGQDKILQLLEAKLTGTPLVYDPPSDQWDSEFLAQVRAS